MIRKRRLFLTHEQMARLTTTRLLAYLRSLHRCHSGPDYETPERVAGTKADPRWQVTYLWAKRLLARRPHVPRTEPTGGKG